MYLGKSLADLDGNDFDMADVFPWVSKMLTRRRSLGYREVKAGSNSPFLKEGETARGHEFHYSKISQFEDIGNCYTSIGSDGRETKEGYHYKNSLASYVHLHFASNPGFAEGFVKRCREQD